MTQVLDYGADERRTARPLTLCLQFSAGCLSLVGVSACVSAFIWHISYGADFCRTLTTAATYCGTAALLGLAIFWIVSIVRDWLRPFPSRRRLIVVAAGAGYGIAPSVLFALADGLEFLGDVVWLIALAVASVVVPSVLAVWLTASRVRRTWGFVSAAGICAVAHFSATVACVLLANVFDENVRYPWRRVGAVIERLAVLLVLPVRPFFDVRAPQPASVGFLIANSAAWGICIALLYRAIEKRSGGAPQDEGALTGTA